MQRTTRERGVALFLVLLFAVLVQGVLTASNSSSSPLLMEAWRTESSDQAAALAEAGAEFARRELIRDPSFAGAKDVVLGPGTFRVLVTRMGAAFEIESWGTLSAERPAVLRGGRVQRRVWARLEASSAGLVVVAWRLD